MRCPKCVEDGVQSRVHFDGARTTLLGSGRPFWDENDVEHIHDSNWITKSFHCSNGHCWSTREQHRCPNCDFGRGPELLAHNWEVSSAEKSAT